MTVLKKFLSSTKANLESLLVKGGRIVLGNESGDLDSAVAALVYSYTLHNVDTQNGFLPLVPVLNIPRVDYPLKTEVTYWLSKNGISDDLLIFRDDISWNEISQAQNIELCLVDHNILPPHDAKLDPLVTSLVDHHFLERTSTPVHGMVVEPVGSCCTLITEIILKKNSNLLTEDICLLLYGTILLDTINLDESANRATAKDIQVIEKLESYLNHSKKKRQAIFRELNNAKCDVSSLSSIQILRKDKKVISGGNLVIAFSSIPLLAQKFQERDNVVQSMKEFMITKQYNVLIIMGIETNEVVQRDLLLYSTNGKILDKLSLLLEEVSNRALQLDEGTCSLPDAKFFFQRNATASRKKVLPIVKQWLQCKSF